MEFEIKRGINGKAQREAKCRRGDGMGWGWARPPPPPTHSHIYLHEFTPPSISIFAKHPLAATVSLSPLISPIIYKVQ
jgi:hypothetical protein